MLTLDDILHPISVAQFRAEYEGRKPLHIPAPADPAKREMLTWDAFNTLLNQNGIWNAENLRLMRNDVAVPVDQYSTLRQTPFGHVMRPWPPKIEVFLSAGASLIANDVASLHLPITHVGAALGEAFAAEIGANIFYSSMGVRAFGTHFDVHEIFAIQTEGEKFWNIYANRADNPVDYPANMTRADFEVARGEVLMTVHMKPGDVLYLPRGTYHDALAKDGPSLHVTFSVIPMYGRAILGLLGAAAMQHRAFRAWVPPAAAEGGAALDAALAELSQVFADIVASPAFREDVVMAQRRIVPRPPNFSLPVHKPITLYRTTGRAFPTGQTAVRAVHEWMIDQQQFALEDMIAHFDFVAEVEVRAAVVAAEAAGALQPVRT